jgi:phage terminase large subunit-like protein
LTPTAVLDACLTDLPAHDAMEMDKALRYDWNRWARPKQRSPKGEWDLLAFVAGRGGGKTRPGAEIMRDLAETYPGIRLALMGRTAADVRDTMVLGESGIIECCPPWMRPAYRPSLRLVVWPNGSQAHMYSADKPDQVRGPQHHAGWGDEVAAWRARAALDNLQDGLRLRRLPNVPEDFQPRLVLTTTPRRTELVSDTFLGPRDAKGNRPVTKAMMAAGGWEYVSEHTDEATGIVVRHKTIVRRWRTEENSANLSAGFAAKRRAKYGQSALGRQELDAEILEKVEGALWQQEVFDNSRFVGTPRLKRVEVAVDPTRSDDPVDECGIVVGGIDESGIGFVLADLTVKGSPDKWIRAAVSAYNHFKADAIIYEGNRLGEDIRNAIRTAAPGIKWVEVTASTEKALRAAPVSALYEQGKVRHVWSQSEHDKDENPLAILEEECCVWDPQDPKASPNRLDALVWLITSLMIGVRPTIAAPRSVGTRPSHWRR